jgi:hypothetical protein
MSQLMKRIVTITVLVVFITGGMVGAYQCRQTRARNSKGEQLSEMVVHRPNGDVHIFIDGISQNSRRERHTLYRIRSVDESGHELSRIFTDYYKPTCVSAGESHLSCRWDSKAHDLDPVTLSEK